LKKAIQYYQKVITLNPDNIHALFALGSYYTNEASGSYRSTGDARKCMELSQRAIGYFEKVHQLNPDDQEIIEILIQGYGNLNMDAERKKMERLVK
jgi:tetratricopeptide (TPR) repeat protein